MPAKLRIFAGVHYKFVLDITARASQNLDLIVLPIEVEYIIIRNII